MGYRRVMLLNGGPVPGKEIEFLCRAVTLLVEQQEKLKEAQDSLLANLGYNKYSPPMALLRTYQWRQKALNNLRKQTPVEVCPQGGTVAFNNAIAVKEISDDIKQLAEVVEKTLHRISDIADAERYK